MARNDSVMGANADNDNNAGQTASGDGNQKALSPAARRALAEAEARRRDATESQPAVEIGGRGGSDPARFGDWEINGRAIDF
ncbi:DUF1674 domain-containing protein [Ciceribacter sp. L1K22]|uniref:DUF1674 domain-containing protein n=1 Tax=Ciceribacter sp. L1K22 TaxID=2820275 RepID=UPI001FEF4DD0|nr:DUF1674 domain-containing protein [Ciceribacter sp. L1K22]